MPPIRIRNELILIDLLVALLIIAVIFFPANALRAVLAVPLLLFFPGYVLLAVLFPRRDRMSAMERAALGFGTSIVVVSLIGLILNYGPWGIGLGPALSSVSIFTFAASIIAWWRRRKLPESERLGITFQLKLPTWSGNTRERALSVILVFALLVVLGMASFVIASPRPGDKFTEFYVLDATGETTDYPLEIDMGMAGNVMLRIVNHEYEEVSYRIQVRESGVILKEVGTVKLEHGQNWEQEVDFTPTRAGENQEMEFVLFKEGDNEPYRSLHLWVNVKEGESLAGS